MSIPQRSKLLRSLRQWKTKAIHRCQQLEALQKRLGELIQSRDAWKGKAQENHKNMTELQATARGFRARWGLCALMSPRVALNAAPYGLR